MSDTPADLLPVEEIAPLLGVTLKSARTYHQTAQRNRREGSPRPTDMPEPDARFGRTPVWRRDTINAWIKVREAAKP